MPRRKVECDLDVDITPPRIVCRRCKAPMLIRPVTPQGLESALEWLRENCPKGEDNWYVMGEVMPEPPPRDDDD